MRITFTMVLMCLLPLVMVVSLFISLETYNDVVHNDCGMAICLWSLNMFVIELCLWLWNRKDERWYTWLFLISTLVLAGVFYVGGKIPFCPECDHVTAEDLGFLIHWIKPWY